MVAPKNKVQTMKSRADIAITNKNHTATRTITYQIETTTYQNEDMEPEKAIERHYLLKLIDQGHFLIGNQESCW